MSNKYDLFDPGGLTGNTQEQIRLRGSLKTAVSANPDMAAEADQLSKKLKMPTDTVERNLERARQLNKFDSLDPEKFKETPETAGWLSDPKNARQAHDDIDALQDVERGFFDNTARLTGQRASELLGNLAAFANQAAEALDQEAPLGGIIIGNDYVPRYYFPEEYAQAMKSTPDLLKEAEKSLVSMDLDGQDVHTWEAVKTAFTDEETGALSAMGEVLLFSAEQGIKSIPDMVAALANLPGYVFSRSAEFGKVRAVNKGKDQADIRDTMEAMPFAVGSAWLERVGAGGIVNAGKETVEQIGKETMKAAIKEIGKAGAREGSTEFAQEGIIEYLGARVGTNAELDVAEAAEQGLAGLIAGSTYGSALSSASVTTRAAVDKIHARRMRSVSDAQKIAMITESGKRAKLNTRNKEAFKDFLRRIGRRYESDTVYVDPEGVSLLFQSAELDPEVMETATMKAIREQASRAQEMGMDIKVPIEQYFSDIAGSPIEEQLNQHVHLDPDAMTLAQRQDDGFMDEVNRALADDMIEQSGEAEVYNDVLGQLIGAGRSKGVAEVNAQFFEKVIKTLASKTGMTETELYRRYQPRILPEIDPLLKTRAKEIDNLDTMLDALRSGDIPQESDVFGQTFSQFVRGLGGIQDIGGELAARDAKQFIRKTGRSLDDIAEAAVEQGYITERSEQAVLDAIDSELAGDPVYMLGKENQQKMATRDELLELEDIIDQSGLDLQELSNQEIRDALFAPDVTDGRMTQVPEFGDAQIEQEFEVEGTGRRVKLKQQAQKVYDQIGKRVDVVQKLLGCVNG